jgi:peptidoglycan/LPS O-acetylase OafA/YrhL
MGAIRLFLALAVLQSHVYGHFLRPAQIYVNNSLVLGVNGGYAVAFFFIISGFLISFVLEDKYDRPGGTAAFYRARALRIYPLWWCLYLIVPFITEGGLWEFIKTHHAYDLLTGFFIYGSDWLLSFKTYPASYTNPMPHGLELGWTLASEMTFYLIAPFVLRSRVWPLVIFAGSVLLRMRLNIAFPPDSDANLWNNWCYYFFPSTVFFFMLGHLTRQVYKNAQLSSTAGWVGLGLAALVCLIQDAHYYFDNVDFYVAILIFAAVLPAVFEASKNNRICNFLGDLTYPLYLSHGVLIVLVESDNSFLFGLQEKLLAAANMIPGNNSLTLYSKGLLVSASIWALALLVAAAVHFAIEKPAVAGLRTVFRAYDAARRQPARNAVAP